MNKLIAYDAGGMARVVQSDASGRLMAAPRANAAGTEQALTFANAAAVGTRVFTADLPIPASSGTVIVSNPSTESDLTVDVFVRETLNGAAQYALLTTFTVTKSPNANNPSGTVNARAVPVDGLAGETVRFGVRNVTVLGAAGGFTARLVLRV